MAYRQWRIWNFDAFDYTASLCVFWIARHSIVVFPQLLVLLLSLFCLFNASGVWGFGSTFGSETGASSNNGIGCNKFFL